MLTASSDNIDDYEPLFVALQDVLGVIIPNNFRSNFIERIDQLLSSYRLDSLASLAEKIQNRDPDACARVLDAVSRRQSSWIMNAELKSILHKYILAQLPEKAKIWTVGCGQGQLAYSVMMEIDKYQRESGKADNFQLIATDVLQDDINQAELAIYNTQQLSVLSDDDKKHFFTPNETNGSAQLKDEFRQKIIFSQCDLTGSFQSLGQIDLIICPEALMYFSNTVKVEILQRFSDVLNTGGIFLTGSNQPVVPFSKSLERVEHPAGVFYRQKG